MTDAFVYDGLRSPFGRHAGALASVRTDDLLAQVMRAVVARSPFAADSIEDVIVGCTNQAGEDSRNVGRNAALLAGLPVGVAGLTVNRLCGSGLAALLDTARAVRCGEGEVFIAGGVEGMSRAPFVLAKADSAYSRSSQMYDTTMGARFPNPALTSEHGADSMPETADNIAADLAISREAADAFALASQQKYAAALARGFFTDEIQPIAVSTGRKTPPRLVADDEHPRPQTDAASLSSLRPLFAGGVVTAGNASGINDGAGALLVASRAAGEAVGATPRGRIVTGAVAGVPPRVMGLGPVPAARKALQRAGLTLAQMDVIEINEAFASQVLGCCQQLGLDPADPRLNPNGGAITVGHPLGASGIRIALSALRHLEQTGGRYALVSMCIGIGQGIAVILERV
ncbi:3-oxoadipyl-CoA thiolase [Insolitispirillum peregrinum]|uniref:acetyl-CoA C-acyltransferase n=1 Tax=Insolitispirillum peregrinum TaxID=80876 RepID=A0A1N7KZQ2_9PROT|nr:3-oxoadipyl-CoA thiolase [Insolitispirillum peregrinum]SIS67041.1 acetyl-CoA C-acetyltransferase [Insolitispirillum peregrinum]